MRSTSPIIKNYIKMIKRGFPLHGKYERKYLRNLKVHLEEFLDEAPDASMDDIIVEFGTPASVISNYFSSVDDHYLTSKLKIKKYLTSSFAIILFLIIFFECWCDFLAYHDYLATKRTPVHVIFIKKEIEK